MESVRLILRGLRWRLGASLMVLAVAVIAMAGAALGPLYASSAAESLVREGLAQSPSVTTGVQTRASIAGQTQFTPVELTRSVEQRISDSALDAWYRQPTMSLTVLNGAPSVDGHVLGQAQVSWYRGQCQAVTVTSGRCPDSPGEAMVSARTAEESSVRIGDRLQLGITSDLEADRVTVVGTYDPATADASAWGLASPVQAQTARIEGSPDRLDEIVVDEATMERTKGDVTAVAFRALEPSTAHLADLPELRAAVAAVTAIPAPSAEVGPREIAVSGLLDYLDSLDPQLGSVGAGSFAITVQLVLLAWFVLFLMISATSEERAGEIALAKLRGMTPRATVAFGLAEPLILLALALPAGLAIAYAADVLLTARYLSPGTEITMSPAVLAALAACFLGGAAAAAIAARGILTAPVLDQLRRTGGRRARLVRSTAIDAAAVALAVAGIYQLRRGDSDLVGLLAPGLISLAAGLLAARALPRIARIEVARTRGSRRVAPFLASRNIARRPTGLRIVVLLSLAVGLAVFAVDGWVVAAANRTDLARAQVGAAEVLNVSASSPGALLAAVDAADPTGAFALAAVTSDNGQGGLVAVDAARLGAVAAWDPAWAGSSTSGIGPLLHPAAPGPPVPIRGRLGLDVAYSPDEEAGDVQLGVAVRAASGLPYEVPLGALRPGTSPYSVELPMCADAPCRLIAFTFTQPVGKPSSTLAGTIELANATDGTGPVALSPVGSAGWRSGAAALASPIEGGAEVLSATSDRVAIRAALDSDSDAAIEVADHPVALPVLQGSELAAPAGIDAAAGVVAGLDGDFTPIDRRGSGVLPRILRNGTLADLQYTLSAMGAVPGPLRYQVWLSGSAPSTARAALEAAGLTVTSVKSVDERSSELDRGGTALALRLFLIAALVALVLAAGTLLANAYVVIRRRAYELAALRALGATSGLLVRAGRREQVVLAFTGVLLGAASGLAAAGVAIPTLLGPSTAAGPPPWFGPAWLAVLALLVTVLALLAVVADLGARRTARRATPDLLRQVQE